MKTVAAGKQPNLSPYGNGIRRALVERVTAHRRRREHSGIGFVLCMVMSSRAKAKPHLPPVKTITFSGYGLARAQAGSYQVVPIP